MADESKPQPMDYRGPSSEQIKVLEDSESRRWRHRRILFRIGLFVLLSPFTFYFGPNLFMFHQLTRLSPSDFVWIVQRFDIPTVRAIKEYQRDTGHLPNDLKDLAPNYLASIPESQQFVNGQFSHWPIYSNSQIYFNCIITYDLTPGAEGWSVSGPFANGPIPLPPVTIGPADRPPSPQK